MSPPNSEHDPVEGGLHALGRHVDDGNPVRTAGLHDLGRQIEESRERGRGRRLKGADAERRGPAHAAPTRRSRPRTLAWVGGTLMLVIVLVAGAAAGYGWYLNHEIHRIDLKNLTSAPVKEQTRHGEHPHDRLDSRCALDGAESGLRAVLPGRQRREQRRRDDPAPQPGQPTPSRSCPSPGTCSSPTPAPTAPTRSTPRWYQGPDQLITAIEEDFGIPIQHFVELNFDSFINVVNALGGIKMYFPEPVYDAESGLNILTTGCITSTGPRPSRWCGRAISSTKPRASPPTPGRVAPRIPERSRAHPARSRVPPGAGHGCQGEGDRQPHHRPAAHGRRGRPAQVDSGLSASDMIDLVLGFHNVDVNTAPQLTLPVAVDQFGSYTYEGGSYGDIEFPAEPQDHAGGRAVPRLLEQRRHLTAARSLRPRDHRLGAERHRRLQPGDRHRHQPAGARVSHRHHRRQPTGGPGSRDGRLLRVEDGGQPGRGTGGRQLTLGRGDHGRGPAR